MILLIYFCVILSKFCDSSTDVLTDVVNEVKENVNFLKRHLSENFSPEILERSLVEMHNMLRSLDRDVKNLQQRSFAWNTFEQQVSTWSEQLLTTGRKLDILNTMQDKIDNLDTKLNAISNLELKVNRLFEKTAAIEGYLHEDLSKLNGKNQFGANFESILEEKKLDGFTIDEQADKLIISNNGKMESENVMKGGCSNRENDNTGDNKQDRNLKLLRIVLKRLHKPCNKTSEVLENILAKLENVENNVSNILKNDAKILEVKRLVIENFDVQKDFIKDLVDTCQLNFQNQSIVSLENEPCAILLDSTNTEEILEMEDIVTHQPSTESFDYTYCYSAQNLSGIISFLETDTNGAGRDYNTRVCEDGWTIIQRRSDYGEQENFNRTWDDYKMGFGQLNKDFWFGNEFIHRLSSENDLILRVELENFPGVKVWAEYDNFGISDESNFYKLRIGGFTGTASDSFSSHNMLKFSTFDKTNDAAPSCCPCASAYGSGWWFNSCFESNLNGVYYKNPYTNGYYKGIIWERWLGNYSLKKTKMMVKPKGNVRLIDSDELTPVYFQSS